MYLLNEMKGEVAEENSAQNYSITTPYEFDVQPGDDEWKNLFTTEEMINACQIPEAIMKKMTTSALIKTILSNSFILDFQTCNDSLYAMEMLEKNFNVFRELQTRTDYMDELKIMDDITSIYGVKCASRLEASNIYTTNADGFVWFKENKRR